MSAEPSEIANFYAHKSIFITGSTGFLGKVLVEKLLRSCPDLKKIYLLIRHKKGIKPQQRIDDLLNSVLFDNVRNANPKFGEKLAAIEGDLDLPALGMSTEDEQMLIAHVDIVIHSAATVKFNEPIKVAVKMNIVGTKKVIELCKKMHHLEAFVHVSTAYANCNRSHVKEEVYQPPVDPERIINLVEWAPDKLTDKITPDLIQPRPNTYTWTKAIAESLVVKECQKNRIACAIVRPSIVGASYKEPIPGWVDFSGATFMFASLGKGLKRIMLGDLDCNADVIPVDYCVNMIIVACWSVGIKKLSNTDEIPVYNNVMAQYNKIDWRNFFKNFAESYDKYPLENPILRPSASLSLYRPVVLIRHYLEELLPSYAIDLVLRMMQKKPIFMRIQSKIAKATETLEYFTTHNWTYSCDNVLNIQSQMSDIDKKIYDIDVRNVDWKLYIDRYTQGIKKYLLKEESKPASNFAVRAVSFVWGKISDLIYLRTKKNELYIDN